MQCAQLKLPVDVYLLEIKHGNFAWIGIWWGCAHLWLNKTRLIRYKWFTCLSTNHPYLFGDAIDGKGVSVKPNRRIPIGEGIWLDAKKQSIYGDFVVKGTCWISTNSPHLFGDIKSKAICIQGYPLENHRCFVAICCYCECVYISIRDCLNHAESLQWRSLLPSEDLNQ